MITFYTVAHNDNVYPTPPPYAPLAILKQASLHMAISLVHLSDVHEGIVVGRSIAADIDQVIDPFACCC